MLNIRFLVPLRFRFKDVISGCFVVLLKDSLLGVPSFDFCKLRHELSIVFKLLPLLIKEFGIEFKLRIDNLGCVIVGFKLLCVDKIVTEIRDVLPLHVNVLSFVGIELKMIRLKLEREMK